MTALRKHSIATRLPRKAVGVTAKLRAEVKAEKLRKLVIEEGAYEAIRLAICPTFPNQQRNTQWLRSLEFLTPAAGLVAMIA